MKKSHIDIITMGCSKNLVDSEGLMRRLESNGYHCSHDPKKPTGEIAIINTCGFIGDAKEESVNMILEFAQRKQQRLLSKLYVMGCLSQRYQKELEAEIPEVDKFYGKFNFNQLVKDLGQVKQTIDCNITSCRLNRHLTTPHHYAYVKIAEGCDRNCAYCAIPIITGKHHSRPKQEILEEIKQLVACGVKEFQIIEQELTYYGVDIDGKRHIADLIEDIANVKGVKWIRLHYAYPNHFPLELLDVMARHSTVCKYLDIALQHISNHMLSRMHRNVSKEETIDLIKTIRERVPRIHLRTTLMVGFPGETEEDFQELVEFVRWAKFERMGAFTYSEEEGTYSAKYYLDDVPQDIKEQRLSKLMAIQQDISEQLEATNVGKILKVIVDRKEGDYYICRTEYSSPEVDPEVLVPAIRRLYVGSFYQVKITDSKDFDLYGEIYE